MEKQNKGHDTILRSLVSCSDSSTEKLKAELFLSLIKTENDDKLAIKHDSESIRQSMF